MGEIDDYRFTPGKVTQLLSGAYAELVRKAPEAKAPEAKGCAA